jgi:MFS family permease
MTHLWIGLAPFLRSPRLAIFMIVFVDVLGLGITIPVLPLFAQNQLGAAAWQITTLTSVFFLAQFLASPFLGRLSDRFGRRPVLILSQAGSLAALLLNGAAPVLGFLYLSRLIDGFTGGNISVAQAYLSDVTEAKNRARGLGLIGAAFGLGLILGPAFGGLVAASFGPRVPFFIAAGVSGLTITLSTLLLPESLTPERRQREHATARSVPRAPSVVLLRRPAVALLLFVAFGLQFSFFTFQTVFVLWMSSVILPHASQSEVTQAVGWLLALRGVFGVLTQLWLVGPAVRRLGELKLMLLGIFADGVGLALIAVMPSMPSVILNAPLLALGGGLALPALVALLTYAAPLDGRGQAIGLGQSASALGSVLGPIVSGFLYENVNPGAPMFGAAASFALTVLVGLLLFRMPMIKPTA